jgi:hypothetical protein
VHPRANLHILVWRREAKFFQEYADQLMIVVLAGAGQTNRTSAA